MGREISVLGKITERRYEKTRSNMLCIRFLPSVITWKLFREYRDSQKCQGWGNLKSVKDGGIAGELELMWVKYAYILQEMRYSGSAGNKFLFPGKQSPGLVWGRAAHLKHVVQCCVKLSCWKESKWKPHCRFYLLLNKQETGTRT